MHPRGISDCAKGTHRAYIMPNRSHILPRLRSTLTAILGGAYTQSQLQQFVSDCTAIALTVVQRKIIAGSIQLHRFGLSATDMAFDSIADLFRSDEDGSLVQVKSFFESLGWESLEDEELLIHLRRLVFTRTNHGLFRVFQEFDPGLGKILRNTKLAIAALENFENVDHFDEPCIAPALCDRLERLPMIDRELLDRQLSAMTTSSERIPEILAKLGRYLREQDEHSRMVPILWIAYAIRGVYGRKDETEPMAFNIEQHLGEQDILRIIDQSCEHVRSENEQRYVGTNGIPSNLYESYFSVIRQILRKRLMTNDGHDVSLFKLLQTEVAGLSRPEYIADHKPRLEYLARLAEKRAIQTLKREYQ